MFRSYFKVAFRSLLRNKAFSVINICGLAIGMASAVLIFLWIQDEFSYDRSYTKQDRLYELMTNHTSDGRLQTTQYTPEIMQPSIKRDCLKWKKQPASNGRIPPCSIIRKRG
jgi:putative ABC transport system permease protein